MHYRFLILLLFASSFSTGIKDNFHIQGENGYGGKIIVDSTNETSNPHLIIVKDSANDTLYSYLFSYVIDSSGWADSAGCAQVAEYADSAGVCGIADSARGVSPHGSTHRADSLDQLFNQPGDLDTTSSVIFNKVKSDTIYPHQAGAYQKDELILTSEYPVSPDYCGMVKLFSGWTSWPRVQLYARNYIAANTPVFFFCNNADTTSLTGYDSAYLSINYNPLGYAWIRARYPYGNNLLAGLRLTDGADRGFYIQGDTVQLQANWLIGDTTNLIIDSIKCTAINNPSDTVTIQGNIKSGASGALRTYAGINTDVLNAIGNTIVVGDVLQGNDTVKATTYLRVGDDVDYIEMHNDTGINLIGTANRVSYNRVCSEWGDTIYLTDGSATTLFTVNGIGDDDATGGTINYRIHVVGDEGGVQNRTGKIYFSAYGTGISTQSDITLSDTSEVIEAGTLTDAWSVIENPTSIEIQVNSNTSLTPVKMYAYIKVSLLDSKTVTLP